MVVRVAQLAFNSGELSPAMLGRADDPKYAAGLAEAKNVIVTPQGPVKNRAGFMYVNKTKFPNKPSRLIPFMYSADQTMVIELGDKYARFHTQGKTLMKGDAPYEIVTPWSAGDMFDIHYTQNADIMTLVHPLYPPQELKRYSETDWRIEPVVINTVLQTPANVVATRATETADEDKNKDKYTQKYVVTALNEDRTQESLPSEPVSVVANLFKTGTTVEVKWDAVEGAKFYRVYKLLGGMYGYISETQELSIIDDNIEPETGQTPPYLDNTFQTNGGITSVEVTSGGSDYEQFYNGIADPSLPLRLDNGRPTVWSASDTKYSHAGPVTVKATVEDAAGMGSGAEVELTVNSYKRTEHVIEPGDAGDEWYRTTYYTEVTAIKVTRRGANYSKPRIKFESNGAAGWLVSGPTYMSLGVIDAQIKVNVTDTTGKGAKLRANVSAGKVTSVDVLYGGSGYTDPKISFEPPYGGSGAAATATVATAGDYPGAVGYFEQRRVFAGTLNRPQQIWMTKTGTESNMSYHLPVKDDDRISFAVASRDLNQILHVVALQQLVLLTSAAEWRVSPLNSDAITPSSISVRPQAYVGASNVQPVLVNNTLLYPAARGGHVREFAYQYQAGGYVSGDLSLRAEHLFDEETIVDMAYAKAPYPIVWCVSSSGKLLGLTYVPEQQIGAWHQHETKGFFESCTVVQEGDEDYLYVVTYRELASGGVRFIERLSTRRDVNLEGCLFVDCAARYEGEATDTITGIDWLEGEEVSVLADGAVVKGLVVENGTVKLPRAANAVSIGLPYVSTVKTLPVVAQTQDGGLGKGRTKNVNKIWIRLLNSTGVSAGLTVDTAKQFSARRDEIYGVPPELKSGEFSVGLPGMWSKDGEVYIVQKDPLPMMVVSVTSEVELGG